MSSSSSWYQYIKDIKNPIDYVKTNFKYYIINNLDKIPMAKEVVASYYCMLDEKTPMEIKITIAGGIAYIILPLDLIPDLTPLIGYSDDAVTFTGILSLVSAYINENHYNQAKELFDSLKN